MHLTRRCLNRGVIRNILIVLLVVLGFIIFIVFDNKCNKLKNTNNELELTINNQINIIKDLNTKNNDFDNKNNDLNNKVLQLEEDNARLKKEKDQLLEEKTKLENEISSLKNHPQTSRRDFKSYMSYTAITNRSSKQWMLQQQATTDENGLRCIDGLPLVAIGTGWGLSVGDRAVVYCDNGNSFEVVIGDIKADIHTLEDNKTTAANNCRCEFIVDMNSLNKTVKSRGSVSVLQEYSGYVVNIK